MTAGLSSIDVSSMLPFRSSCRFLMACCMQLNNHCTIESTAAASKPSSGFPRHVMPPCAEQENNQTWDILEKRATSNFKAEARRVRKRVGYVRLEENQANKMKIRRIHTDQQKTDAFRAQVRREKDESRHFVGSTARHVFGKTFLPFM